ncbi:hypothetical protein PsorP6_011589 [Peronosclerospora sorghi]|uniref:Uncharacterized protein n=1 Tax=Peronosclerospora sorghi TaxID=230839 RepID=A0ACC0WLK2_9STRA|nr:hypothetical protein PsorP6_011589 [Peronosclerospora sorghi]
MDQIRKQLGHTMSAFVVSDLGKFSRCAQFLAFHTSHTFYQLMTPPPRMQMHFYGWNCGFWISFLAGDDLMLHADDPLAAKQRDWPEETCRNPSG